MSMSTLVVQIERSLTEKIQLTLLVVEYHLKIGVSTQKLDMVERSRNEAASSLTFFGVHSLQNDK